MNVSYTDVCVRALVNPIVLTPHYSSAQGASIPEYSAITIRNFRSVASTVNPVVTIQGYDASHVTDRGTSLPPSCDGKWVPL